MTILQVLPDEEFLDAATNFFTTLGLFEGILVLILLIACLSWCFYLYHWLSIKRLGFRDANRELHEKITDMIIEQKEEVAELVKEHDNKIIMLKDNQKKEIISLKDDHINKIINIFDKNNKSTEDIVEDHKDFSEDVFDKLSDMLRDKNKRIEDLYNQLKHK